MSISDEVRQLAEAYTKSGRTLFAEDIVYESENKEKWPSLHAHLWGVSEAKLAQEARISRAHRLLIKIKITTETGHRTRYFVHTPGNPGYAPVERVVSDFDLAAVKLRQLGEDIKRAHARFADFKSALPAAVAIHIDESIAESERRIEAAIKARAKRELEPTS